MSLISESLKKAQQLKNKKRINEGKNGISRDNIPPLIMYSIISKGETSSKKQQIFLFFICLSFFLSIIFISLHSILFKKNSSINNKTQINQPTTLEENLEEKMPLSSDNSSVLSSIKANEDSNKEKISTLMTGDLDNNAQPLVLAKISDDIKHIDNKTDETILLKKFSQTSIVKEKGYSTSLNKDSLSEINTKKDDALTQDKDFAEDINTLSENKIIIMPVDQHNKAEKNPSQGETQFDDIQDEESYIKLEIIKNSSLISKIPIEPEQKDLTSDDYNNLGLDCYYKGEYRKAIENFKKSILLNPNNFESYMNLGIILKKRENLNYALSAYKKAISIKPTASEPYYNIGILFDDMGLINNAIVAYQKFLEYAPEKYQDIKLKVQKRINNIKGIP